MKNKIVFINIFYEILEYACEFGLAYIVSRLVSFSLEVDTRQTVIFAVSLLLALLFITVLKHGLKVNISRKLLSEKQAFQMNIYRSMMKVIYIRYPMVSSFMMSFTAMRHTSSVARAERTLSRLYPATEAPKKLERSGIAVPPYRPALRSASMSRFSPSTATFTEVEVSSLIF